MNCLTYLGGPTSVLVHSQGAFVTLAVGPLLGAICMLFIAEERAIAVETGDRSAKR